MVRVGILGATGYTALELIKILLRHSEVEITVLTSRQEEFPLISDIHPQLAHSLDLQVVPLNEDELAEKTDCVFSCLPHAASAATVAKLMDRNLRVIDFSADYRLDDVGVYEQWYATTHPDPGRVGKAEYGLCELNATRIASADLVANPGCYPTSAILPLAPLLDREMIEPQGIIIDSKSGVSGAGRTPKLTTHYPECNESVAAYGVGAHRHTPEIEQILGRYVANGSAGIVFVPHLVPMDRGILTTAYSRPRSSSMTQQDVLNALQEFYARRHFVRIGEHLPSTKHTMGTNFCDISARIVGDYVITVSCLDNLIKGASGAAVQNMNLMFGFPEKTALV